MASAKIARTGVMRSLQIIKIVELALFAAGVAMTYAMRSGGFAFGVGLVAQSSLMLVFDLFAEARAEPYLRALQGLAR